MNHFAKLLIVAASAIPMGAAADSIELSALDGINHITCLSGETVRANKSTNNNPITIMGHVYDSGIGTHAPSVAVVELNGATDFHTIIGVDDEAEIQANHGIVTYVVTLYGETADQTKQVASATLDRQDSDYADTIDIDDLSGWRYLKLELQQGTQAWADHADWADARFNYSGTAPRFIAPGAMYSAGTVDLPTQATLDGATIVPLSSLQLSNITNGWGTIRANKSIDNNTLSMKSIQYTSGVGLHAPATMVIKLNGSSPKFHALLGIDDEVAAACAGKATSNVDYQVILRDIAGRETVKLSGTINYNDAAPVEIDLDDLTPYKYLILQFDDNNGNASDHIDLCNAYFEFLYQNSNEPEIVSKDVIATNLSCATTVFSQPGVKFMQKLHCVNEDAVISVGELPAGLSYNAERRLIEGIIDTEGEYTYDATVTVGEEQSTTTITLTVSSNLMMPTPFMGWLSWNSVEGNISYEVVKNVTDNLLALGLAEAGYNYVMCDDHWHGTRDANGKPRANTTRFPGGTLKPSADYVHSKGLKFGNYSDVAANTCAGEFGSLDYEAIDAETYAEWDIDMVKVDYCHAPAALETARNRYKKFGDELTKHGIVQFVCEWGQREPWKWAAEIGSPVWRATYDSRDCWRGATGGIGILQSIEGMKDLWMYNGVNRWNDADMVCIGIHGKGKSSNDLCASGAGMTMDEYRTQMALWCMWSSPIALSFDLSKEVGAKGSSYTQEDIDLLTNPDLIAINQDRMGQAGVPIFHNDDFFVMAKDLENGDVAISVTNLSAAAKDYTVDLSSVPGLNGTANYYARELLQGKNLENISGTLEIKNIPSHATAIYRLGNELFNAGANGNDDPQAGINSVAAADALGNMTVNTIGTTVSICLPGTGNAAKRILVSDIDGRVVAAVNTTAECADIAVPAHGFYLVSATCAARTRAAKISL